MAPPGKSHTSKSWVDYLRSSSRQLSCPLCHADVRPPTIDGFKSHVQNDTGNHLDLEDEADIKAAFERMRINPPKPQSPTSGRGDHHNQAKRSRKRSGPAALESQNEAAGQADNDEHDDKKLCSPPSSPPPPLTPGRNRGKQVDNVREFKRGIKVISARQLWSPDDEQQPRRPQSRAPQPGLFSHVKCPPQARQGRQSQLPSRLQQSQSQPHQDSQNQPSEDSTLTVSQMILQPETRPISQEQLVAEVKGIYAGLVMVESKCIEVDNVQSSNKDTLRQLSNEQWQALIALHRTLLHEHHDFFLASQHPSASPALRRLAAKYAMPARMWRHGIHSFLELLRHKLPFSLEPMLTFIYIAYSMMALLYETVPAFEDTWIECLGDLGRYRMAIEDDDIRDRETWTSVSRYWYSKASDKSPTTGRLYHHLAILARPNALQQVYYYTKSLCVPIPFLSARESIMTLFDPVLSSTSPRLEPIDAAFIRVHAIIFSGKCQDQLEPSMKQFFELLDGHIARITKGWLEPGYLIGISLGCSLLGYGDESNVLKHAITFKRPEESDQSEKVDRSDTAKKRVSTSELTPTETFLKTLSFVVRTYEIITHRWGDMNILPYLHTQLVFLNHMSRFPAAMSYLERDFPWKLTAMMLNYLKQSCKLKLRITSEEFPRALKNDIPRPLPEDYAMRGLIYTENYFPNDWFSFETVDEDETYVEQGSMMEVRKERILWLGRRIASLNKWLRWDESQTFSVAPEYDIDLDVPEATVVDTQEDQEDVLILNASSN